MEEDFNMRINKQMSKIICRRNRFNGTRIQLKDGIIQEVEKFNYLRSIITNDGRNFRKIVSRINQAKNSFNKKKYLLTSKTLKVSLKIR